MWAKTPVIEWSVNGIFMTCSLPLQIHQAELKVIFILLLKSTTNKLIFFNAKAGEVSFDKKRAPYKAKLFKFKQGDQTVLLLVCRKNNCASELDKRIVYANEKRIYYIDDACLNNSEFDCEGFG